MASFVLVLVWAVAAVGPEPSISEPAGAAVCGGAADEVALDRKSAKGSTSAWCDGGDMSVTRPHKWVSAGHTPSNLLVLDRVRHFQLILICRFFIYFLLQRREYSLTDIRYRSNTKIYTLKHNQNKLLQYTHTYTQPFNGPFSRTTWVGRYQKGKTNLDLTEARDGEWVAVASAGPYASLHLAPDIQPRQHSTTRFLQAGCPSCHPTNSVKALKAVSCYSNVQSKLLLGWLSGITFAT